MNKKQLSIKKTFKKIGEIYAKDIIELDDYYKIKHLIFKLYDTFSIKEISLKDLKAILDVELQIVHSKKTFRQKIEQELLEYMANLPGELYEPGIIKPLVFAKNQTKEEKIALGLLDFGKTVWEIKIARDTFSSKRKGFVIELLGNLAHYFEFPEFINFCRQAVKGKSNHLYAKTLKTLEEYNSIRGVFMDEEIYAVIKKNREK